MLTVIVAVVSAVAGAAVAWTVAGGRSATAGRACPAERTGPRWSDVIDQLSVGVVVAGPSGRVHHRNRAADAFAGTHMGLLVDDTVDRLLKRALAGESSRQNLELYGPPRSAMVVTAAPLEGGGAVAMIEDVSERRRVDAVRTDFVANISHELRTPVGALAVLAEALAEENDLDVVHRVANRMVDEAMRVTRTIDDLLELSRIELGEEPRREIVDVVDIVEEAIARTRQLAEDRRIDVSSPRSCPRACASTVTAASSSRRSATSSRTPSSTASRARACRCGRGSRGPGWS